MEIAFQIKWIIILATGSATFASPYTYFPVQYSGYYQDSSEYPIRGRSSRSLSFPVWFNHPDNPVESNSLLQLDLEVSQDVPEFTMDLNFVDPSFTSVPPPLPENYNQPENRWPLTQNIQSVGQPLPNSFELLNIFDNGADYEQDLQNPDIANYPITSFNMASKSESSTFSQPQQHYYPIIPEISQETKSRSNCRTWTSPEGIQFVLKNPTENLFKTRFSRHLNLGSDSDNDLECNPDIINNNNNNKPQIKFSPPYYSPGSASHFVNI